MNFYPAVESKTGIVFVNNALVSLAFLKWWTLTTAG